MLRFERKQQNSVKQLSFNKKINFKNKIKLQKKRLLGEISITTDRQMIPPLWQKVKEPINEGERGE